MAGNQFEIISIRGLQICHCEDYTCVRTAAFPPARFVAESRGDDWHRAIRRGGVVYDDLCELGERKTGDQL